MADIYTGIGVLKKINSLFKGKVNSSGILVDKSKRASALNQVKPSTRSDKIITSEIKIDKGVYIAVEKDRRIHELICHRLACEKAIRLKQEIKNFSSVWLSRLS